jgi:5-keto-L-gluconate epimerase
MKLAITVVNEASKEAPFVLRGDYVQTLKEAAKIGYDAVELHLAHPNDIDVQEIKEVCKELGISVSSIGTGLAFLKDGITLTSNDEKVRNEAINRIMDFINLGKELDCVVIIGLIKGIVKENGSFDNYIKNLNKSLEDCIEVAEEAGVTLVMEAVNRYESDFINTISECIEYIDRFNSENIKVHIDTFHMNMEEDDIAKNIIDGGGRIGHVHIADSNRQFPGKGHFDFKETVKALKEIGYKGALSVECLSLPTPEDAAKGAYQYLRNLV